MQKDEKIGEENTTISPQNETKNERVGYKIDNSGTIIFKYRLSRFCRWSTAIISIIGVAIFLFLSFESSGSYLSAWYLSFAVAIFLLMLISFPRKIKLKKEALDIECILEYRSIRYCDIKRLYIVPKGRFRSTIRPVVASYGFGGYYGYFFNFRNLKFIRFYATKLTNLVAIEDIYSDRYIINCDDLEFFISNVRKRISEAKQAARVEE